MSGYMLCSRFHRALCLRRAGRPIKDFLKPLPHVELPASPPSSPMTSHHRTRTRHSRHTIVLPISSSSRHSPYSPSNSPRPPTTPEAAHTYPRRPSGHGRQPSLDAMARHLAGWSRRPAAPHMETLPVYDDKDMPPRYQDVVLAPGLVPQSPPGPAESLNGRAATEMTQGNMHGQNATLSRG